MEYLTGAALVLLGILIVVFGGAKPSRGDGAIARALSLPAWLDAVVRWVIGIACVWFGAQVLLGHAHYF